MAESQCFHTRDHFQVLWRNNVLFECHLAVNAYHRRTVQFLYAKIEKIDKNTVFISY